MPVTQRLSVARIGRAHGIRGEVTVQLFTDAPGTRLVPGAALFTQAQPPPQARGKDPHLVIDGVREHNGVLLITFAGVHDRNQAEALRGQQLYADIDAAAEVEPDAWYDHELVGLNVRDTAGVVLGSVVAVEHLPAQDLLEIRRPDGELRLIPLVTAFVPEVNLEAGYVLVTPPPGLINDLDPDDDA